MKTYQHYINGALCDPASGEWFDSENPYTGEVWAKIARGNAEDVDRAVTAAKAAFDGEWGATGPTARGKLMVKLAEIIEREAVRLGEIEVRDNGKLIAEMGAQTKYLAEWYRYFGGLADKIEGAVIPSDKPGIFNFTRYEPLGVIGMITAWNSPLLLLAWKLAPALAAGNTAVVKPSEYTSASTLEFMALIEEAGFPAGVVNAITGFGMEVGAPLVDHPHVDKIAFTGSDVSGQKIYEAAAKKIMPVTLELGGKSPNIVFEDADFEAAVMGAISGIFAATGQTCIAGSRLLVQRSIHDKFVNGLSRLRARRKLVIQCQPKRMWGRSQPCRNMKKSWIISILRNLKGLFVFLAAMLIAVRGQRANNLSSQPSLPAFITKCASPKKKCLGRFCQ